LAADRRALIGSLIRTTTKIFRVGDELVAYAGDADAGEALFAWYQDGANVDNYPEPCKATDSGTSLMIVTVERDIWVYERTPYPIKYSPQTFAIGSGRAYAYAAMYCGRTAAEAVEVTCVFDCGCGNGVDTLQHNTV
jgi:ATP-dependent protease HslVU (ClpYQ) peptidase subunit